MVCTNTDSEHLGSTPLVTRPDGKALLADLMVENFDVLLVEGLSRLRRQVAESESLINRQEARGTRIVGISEGYDARSKGRKVTRIARIMINVLYIDDVWDKTPRGIIGNRNRGISACGRTYGYRSERTPFGRQLIID